MPYKSKSQMRKFFAMEDRHELPKGTAEHWAHETPNIKKLPERKKKLKKKAALGPFDTDRAADTVAEDAIIQAIEKNRKEHPVHYWANPFVRGPLSEVMHRLGRRGEAAMGTNTPLAVAGSVGPLIAGAGPISSTARNVGLGLSGLAGLVGPIVGGAARKEKMREGHAETAKYDERKEDQEEISKSKKASFAISLGKQAASIR